MLGAIVGDIVGSRFEFNNHKSKVFELFGDCCFATDDMVISTCFQERVKAIKILLTCFLERIKPVDLFPRTDIIKITPKTSKRAYRFIPLYGKYPN